MLATQIEVSDGTLNIINVGIEFFNQADISVSLDQSETSLVEGVDYIWSSATSIQFLNTLNTPGGLVPNGVEVVIRRSTEIEQMYNIYDGGAPFSRLSLDENFEQLLFLAQEYRDGLGLDGLRNDLDMNGYRVVNVGDPVNPGDAVNKAYVDEGIGRTLRVPSSEGSIPELPPAIIRANKLLAFDANGDPYGQLPAAGSATQLQLDLADELDRSKGIAMIGRGGQVCSSIADLRTLLKISPAKNAFVLGYHTRGDGGGGFYWLDITDITSVDNGVTVIVAADGGRWKLANIGGSIDVRQAGAKGDGSDDAVALQRAVDAARDGGYNLLISQGIFTYSSTILLDNSTSVYFMDTKKIDIRGTGMNTSRLKYTGAGTALRIVGGTNGTLLSSQMFIELHNFGLEGTQVVGSIGLAQDTCQHIQMSCCDIMFFDIALDLLDVDFASFRKIIFHWNVRGIQGQERSPRNIASTRPNGIEFVGCQWAGNTKYAGLFLGSVAITILGGDVEGNGYGAGTTWGFMFQDAGIQGGVGCNLYGVYFEHNKGIADVWIIAIDAPAPGYGPKWCVHNINGCTFNRPAADAFVDHHIVFSNNKLVAGLQKLNVVGCSFKSYNDYVPNAARQYIFFGADARTAENFYMQGCFQQEAIESITQYTNYVMGIAPPVQSIPNAAVTLLVLSTTLYDPDGLKYNTSPHGFVVPETGVYDLKGGIQFPANAVNTRILIMTRNGAGIATDSKDAVGVGQPTSLAVSRDMLLTKGDLVQLSAYQDSGGALSIASPNQCYLTCRMVAAV